MDRAENADIETTPLWWQTVLQILAASVLLIPLVYVSGFVILLLSFIQGQGIDALFRAAQYGFAAFLSLYIPTLMLKRSHWQIAAAIWCTAVTVIYVGIIIVALAAGVSSDRTFWEWIEIAASIVGFVAGCITYVQTYRA